MSIRESFEFVKHQLRYLYESTEASNIADWVIEHVTQTGKSERLAHTEKKLSKEQEALLEEVIKRLLTHEPVQYVLNESWFCGLKFYVDKNVLIPRPETEELVEWVIANCRFPLNELRILDIGSGSGCIPIALKRRLRKAEVWACDISEAALQVARKNADTLGTPVKFLQLDFLNKDDQRKLPAFDIIVSNPPYIPIRDREQIQPNVRDFEPSTALFVPNNDPFLFYKVIAEFGKGKLIPGGAIYVEINENLGEETMSVFQSYGFSTELKKDMQGKDRMIKATI